MSSNLEGGDGLKFVVPDMQLLFQMLVFAVFIYLLNPLWVDPRGKCGGSQVCTFGPRHKHTGLSHYYVKAHQLKISFQKNLENSGLV